jgi:membrane protease YdiL (CAAX protease family)
MDSIEPQSPEPIPRSAPQWKKTGMWWAVFVFVFLLMLVVGGHAREFAVVGLEVLPFTLLAVAAYAAEDRGSGAKALVLGLWFVLISLAGILAVLFSLAGLVEAAPEMYAPGSQEFPVEHFVRVGLAFVATCLAGAVSLTCFIPFVRQQAARILAIDPQSFIHATALATVIAIAIMGIVPLLVLGEPPLLIMIRSGSLEDAAATEQQQLRATFYSLVWSVPAAFFAVGYPRKRTLVEAAHRLAMVWPTRKQLVAAVLFTAAFTIGMEWLDQGVLALWDALGLKTTDRVAVLALFSFAAGPVAAIIVALAAGLGEELVFRGVLQPRLGILLPALMFASVHGFQYNFDALVQVFILGVGFGFIRKWSNTTTTAIIHMAYDCIAFLWMPPV